MSFKRFLSILICMMILTVVPCTVFAEDDGDYCYDESAFVMMTPEEASAKMLELGIGMDKMSVYSGYLTDAVISVLSEKSNNRIEVYVYTRGSIVANEIGVKNLKFYRVGSSSNTLLKSDAKLYTGFQQFYVGGYYYTAPEDGKQYYAEGTNYAIFTTTERAIHNTSLVVTY